MKYYLNINQKAIIDNDYQDIDIIDACILDAINTISGWEGIKEFKDIDGKYYWISHNLILKEVPLLRTRTKSGTKPFSKDAIKKRINHLCDLGFIKKHKDNQSMGQLYIRCMPKLKALFRDTEPRDIYTHPRDTDTHPLGIQIPTPRDTDTHPLGIQIPTPRDTDTHYNSTNNNNTNNNIDIEVKTSTKSIPYQSEFLEIFKILEEYSGNNFRVNLNKLQLSNKYKDFARFYKAYKSEYKFEEIKEVVKFTALKNLGTDSQKYTTFSTLFRPKNFERNFDFWLSSKNKPLNDSKSQSNTNIQETQIKLTDQDLERFKAINDKLNDSRFTKSLYLSILGGKRFDSIRNRYTGREIVKKIKEGLSDSSQAYNKNRSLTELINEKF